MQGYKKTTEERNFEKKLEQFFMIHHIYFAKNYGEEVNEFSRPDFFVCLHGRFIAIEIENYTPDPETGETPVINPEIIQRILNNKGGFLKVSPDTFDEFKNSFLFAMKTFHLSKSFDEKINDALTPKPSKPRKNFTVETKKKPLFQKKNEQSRFSAADSKYNSASFNYNRKPF